MKKKHGEIRLKKKAPQEPPKKEAVIKKYRGYTLADLSLISSAKFDDKATGRFYPYHKVVRAFVDLFLYEPPFDYDPEWVKEMVGYELQRHLVYDDNEPLIVLARRQKVLSGSTDTLYVKAESAVVKSLSIEESFLKGFSRVAIRN